MQAQYRLIWTMRKQETYAVMTQDKAAHPMHIFCEAET